MAGSHSRREKEQWEGVGSVDLHSQSPPSSEMLLESQMVSILAGKKHTYRNMISQGEAIDFLNKKHRLHRKRTAVPCKVLTPCDFVILDLIIIHHFLKGAQLVCVCGV